MAGGQLQEVGGKVEVLVEEVLAEAVVFSTTESRVEITSQASLVVSRSFHCVII